MSKKKIVFGVIGVFILLGVLGSLLGDDDQTNTVTQEDAVAEANNQANEENNEANVTEEEQNNETNEDVVNNETADNATENEENVQPEEEEMVYDGEPVYEMLEEVHAGELTYVTNQIYADDYLEDDFSYIETSGLFLIVDMEITNNDNESRTIDSSMFKVIDANSGSTFSPNSEASRLASGGTTFFLESINPEFSIEGRVAFEVPDMDRPFILEVDSGMMFAGGETQMIYLEPVQSEEE